MNSWRIADRIALKTRVMLMVKLNKKKIDKEIQTRFSSLPILSNLLPKEYFSRVWYQKRTTGRLFTQKTIQITRSKKAVSVKPSFERSTLHSHFWFIVDLSHSWRTKWWNGEFLLIRRNVGQSRSNKSIGNLCCCRWTNQHCAQFHQLTTIPALQPLR